MSTRRLSADDALETDTFFRLYVGACRLENPRRRLIACAVLLLAGRLGLRLAEIQHLREAWVDWERGEICIPELDPCACRRCWIQAQAKWLRRGLRDVQDDGVFDEDLDLADVDRAELAEHLDPEDLTEIVHQEQWSPKSDRSARVIAFGFSERLTGVLLALFSEMDCIEMTQEGLRQLVKAAAEEAPQVDPEYISPHRLRATGETFLADAGANPKMLQDLAGWERIETARSYVRASGRHNTHELYHMMGKPEWAPPVVPEDPEHVYPLIANPVPIQGEPFEPPGCDPELREARALQTEGTPIRLRHPREFDLPTGRAGFPAADVLDYDAREDDIPGHEAGHIEWDGEVAARATTITEFVDDHAKFRARDAEPGQYRRAPNRTLEEFDDLVDTGAANDDEDTGGS